ncbi:MAG: hypothetical protein IT518_26555 [Burkholderiales bacterium]|nr:hypothetical protein [Burkholderiales bacterium]
MSSQRPGQPGATRQCPHCREMILESAVVCPACRHHLRYGAGAVAEEAKPDAVPLRIEGTIRHPPEGEPWEYTVVVTVRNDRGEEIARKLVNVGALSANELRSFTLSVEATVARGKAPPREARPVPARGRSNA